MLPKNNTTRTLSLARTSWLTSRRLTIPYSCNSLPLSSYSCMFTPDPRPIAINSVASHALPSIATWWTFQFKPIYLKISDAFLFGFQLCGSFHIIYPNFPKVGMRISPNLLSVIKYYIIFIGCSSRMDRRMEIRKIIHVLQITTLLRLW